MNPVFLSRHLAAGLLAILSAGCVSPLSKPVTREPVSCDIHYRNLSVQWVAGQFSCAGQASAPLSPRVRNLAAAPETGATGATHDSQ